MLGMTSPYALRRRCSGIAVRRTSANSADALFVVLEHAGLVGEPVGTRLSDYVHDGLEAGGWRGQVVVDEPWPLSPLPRADCLRTGDVFARPPEADDD
jgi:hypothetical protein